ncbi:MAG: hypothetical protein KC635_10380 [Myxococcales bacterium]|nr:hypothetical protein [Myxococcales bacterium]
MRAVQGIAVAFVTILAGAALAAPDATITLQGDVNPAVSISGVNANLSLTLVPGNGVTTADANGICVYSSSPGAQYTLDIASTSNGGDFTLDNVDDTGVTIGFTATWDDATTTGNTVTVGANAGPFIGTTDVSCSASNAALHITPVQADVDTATTGHYTTTLTLTVAPI